MSGLKFRSIRKKLGLRKNQFAELIGYKGTSTNNVRVIERYENEGRVIPRYLANLVWLISLLHSREEVPLDENNIVKFPEESL